jgi:hypothetical protein
VQLHGGKCDRCGVDFAKYGAMLVFRATQQAEVERAKAKERASIFKQIVMIPVTGGLSLLKFVKGRSRGE